MQYGSSSTFHAAASFTPGWQVTSKVHVFTMCGRRFVRHLLGRPLPTETPPPDAAPAVCAPVRFHHVVMNLPASGIEFIGAPSPPFHEGLGLASSRRMRRSQS
jgi:hypothetical protein